MPEAITEELVKTIASQTVQGIMQAQNREQAIASTVEKLTKEAETYKATASQLAKDIAAEKEHSKASLATASQEKVEVQKQLEQATASVTDLTAKLDAANKTIASQTKQIGEFQIKDTITTRQQAIASAGVKVQRFIDRAVATADGKLTMSDEAFKEGLADLVEVSKASTPATPAVAPASASTPAPVTAPAQTPAAPANPDLTPVQTVSQATAAVAGGTVTQTPKRDWSQIGAL